MLNYSLLKSMVPQSDRPRVVRNLEALREHLVEALPQKDCEGTLLLGTWNIRDFGKTSGGKGYGDRAPEALFYIAEIISRFDFVALQEVNDIDHFERLMRILGLHWDYVATDVTHRSLGGNGERLTYCWDKRKVRFQNIAGEVVLPADALVSKVVVPQSDEKAKPLYAGKQFRRSPFVARFQSGWFKYDICTVHIYFGEESGDKLQERIEEIDRIAAYLAKVAKEARREQRSTILLGDFNIVHPEHKTMQALTDHGFVAPKTLADPTNFIQTKHYDQIVFLAPKNLMRELEKVDSAGKSENAGVLDIFKTLYTPAQLDEYVDQMRASPNGKKKTDAQLPKFYRDWLTYQLSDHRPLWVRIPVDESDAYLKRLVAP